MPYRLDRSNGRPHSHPWLERPQVARSQHFPIRKYLFALLATGSAVAAIAVIDLTLSFPPFVLFAMAAGLSWRLGGSGPGMSSVVLATLASDFLFVEPRYELSLDFTVARLAVIYVLCALGSRVLSSWTAKRRLSA